MASTENTDNLIVPPKDFETLLLELAVLTEELRHKQPEIDVKSDSDKVLKTEIGSAQTRLLILLDHIQDLARIEYPEEFTSPVPVFVHKFSILIVLLRFRLKTPQMI